jgi:hypothetical protein
VLFITGFADQSALGKVDYAGIIKKPFLGDELANKVHAALGSTSLPSNSKRVPLLSLSAGVALVELALSGLSDGEGAEEASHRLRRKS